MFVENSLYLDIKSMFSEIKPVRIKLIKSTLIV